jgi:hypothetical protein
MRILFALVLAGVVGGLGLADPPDETLRHYLAKSQYALVREVVAEPTRIEHPSDNAAGSIQKGQVVYKCEIKVVDQLHYPDGPLPKVLFLCVVRWPDKEGELPAGLKKGDKAIFFLRWVYSGITGASTVWVTSDPWFGVQRYNAKMAELLKEQGKRKEPTN